MKFGQQTWYSRRNTFLENSYTKCGEKASPRPFSKKIKIEPISGSAAISFIVCFYCNPSQGLSKYIDTKV